MSNSNARDLKFMEFTRRVAISNNHDKAKMAACIVIRNEIISIGINSSKSHPLASRFRKNEEAIFKHAEIDSIIKALKHVDEEELTKATLYVYRVKKKTRYSKVWSDGLAEPCSGCKQAIEHFGIKRVVFSTEEDGVFSEL